MIRTLYHISIGVWITCCAVTILYDNPTPMWISLVVMNVLNIMSIEKKK